MAHLCFQTAYPGDVFLSIPLLKRMREWDPENEIVLACRPGLGEIFLKYGIVDRVIDVNKKSRAGRSAAWRDLRGEVWDTIICPHESPRTAAWMARLRARGPKVGFHKWWNAVVFSKRVQKPVQYPDALRQLSLLAPVDRVVADLFADENFERFKSPVSRRSPFSLSDPEIPDWASMRIRPHEPEGRKIFLAPGSVWPTKRWTVEGYEELSRLLVARGFEVILVGSPDEHMICARIAAKIPEVKNLAGKTTLAELVDLLATGLALVCNDSGAMHAAALSGLPTVAIFGPTTLDLGFRPWNNRAVIVQRELKCRPCGRHGSNKCPLGTHECMTQISAEDVYLALTEM